MTRQKSRLVLGTAQLGMPYGVANAGQPDRAEAYAILDAALRFGINTFDTASAYGSAEEVLGGWINERSLQDTVSVVSKCRSSSAAEVLAELKLSLSRLHLSKLDGYLLHTPEWMYDPEVVRALHSAKASGLVDNIGVSVYDGKDVLHALTLELDYIQVPYNALDQRLDRVDFFSRAREKGVTVFARSAFLQGLLLMEPDAIPPRLAHARPYVETFRTIAVRWSLSPLEAALLFVQGNRGIDHIVCGVDTVRHLEEICSAALRSIPNALFEELKQPFTDIPETVVDPRTWNT